MRNAQAIEVADPACPGCGAAAQTHGVSYPLFRHLDFTVCHPGPADLGRCPACGLVFRILGGKDEADLDALYRGAAYMAHKPAEHRVMVAGRDGPVTQAELQTELLAACLTESAPAILDIGCLDGRLLRAFAARYETGDLCGFDVADRPEFPRGKRLRLVTGALEDITGAFDLVVLSHALQYIRDLPHLFARIGALLRPGGVMFVQVPDFSRKPCSLLLGDLHFHFTPDIVNRMFHRAGFNCSIVDKDWFPRDVMALGRCAESEPPTGAHPNDEFGACLAELDRMAGALDGLAGDGTLGVLGTTIEAAFAASRLGDKANFFVDENPEKVGTIFHDRPVMHPNGLDRNHRIIVPMGRSGDAVCRRLAADYPGHYSRL